jgi:hypothetical protein
MAEMERCKMIIKKWTGAYGDEYRLERINHKLLLFRNNEKILEETNDAYTGKLANDENLNIDWFWLIVDMMKMLGKGAK